MSLAIKDAKNVVIKNWSIIQPQFWYVAPRDPSAWTDKARASILIDTENVLIRDFYVNATSYDPAVSLRIP
jgi:galacturan 1,4-alpha-galacturonidase